MSRNTLPTIPDWASYTPDTGTNELPIARPLPALEPAAPTEPMHVLDLLPSVEPLRAAWNSALTVAGVFGVALLVWGFLQATRPLGEWLLYLAGSCAL